MHRLSFEKVFYHLDNLNKYVNKGDCTPVHMIVGLTNLCNHQCIWCYGYDSISEHYNENDYVPKDKLLSVIRDASALGLKALTFVGTGEPTLHAEFASIAYEIKASNVDLGIFTNGAPINEDKANAIVNTHTFIRVSCSAADQEEHNCIHHGGKAVNDFDRIVKNIQRLLSKRGGNEFPTIGVQFSVSHHNWQSLVKSCAFWKKIGVDYFAIKPVYKNPGIMKHEENMAPLDEVFKQMDKAKALEDEKFLVYAKYEQFKNVLAMKSNERGYNYCHGQAFSTFLDPDGKIYVCGNMHGKEDFCIGNAFDIGFQKVWEGARRKELLKNLDVTTCPTGCRMDPLNKIIHDLKIPDRQTHPNFL